MSTNERVEAFVERRKEIDKQIKKLNNELKTALFEEAKDFLAKYPAVENIHWYQYTPYFNDGEACTFGVGEPGVGFNSAQFLRATLKEERLSNYRGEPLTDDQLRSGWGDGYSPGNFKKDKEIYKDMGTVFAIIGCLDENAFLDLFGDHAWVVIDRTGINVSEFDHE